MATVELGLRHLDGVEAVLGSVMRHARVPHQLLCVDGAIDGPLLWSGGSACRFGGVSVAERWWPVGGVPVPTSA
jgi:hypothetical protein